MRWSLKFYFRVWRTESKLISEIFWEKSPIPKVYLPRSLIQPCSKISHVFQCPSQTVDFLQEGWRPQIKQRERVLEPVPPRAPLLCAQLLFPREAAAVVPLEAGLLFCFPSTWKKNKTGLMKNTHGKCFIISSARAASAVGRRLGHLGNRPAAPGAAEPEGIGGRTLGRGGGAGAGFKWEALHFAKSCIYSWLK